MHMKLWLALLCSLVISLTSCVSNNHGFRTKRLSMSQLVSHNGYSTVALVHYDEDNMDQKISDISVICAGVWIDDKHILTANHCAKHIQKEMQAKRDKREKAIREAGCDIFEMLLNGGCLSQRHKVIGEKNLPIHFVQWLEADDPGKEPTAWHLSKVVGWDDRYDLALLEAAGQAIPPHETATLATVDPEIGESVHIVGHPNKLYWTFLEGTVASYRGSIAHVEDTDGPFLQIRSPVYFGNSGGGAFNDRGELVGIADFLMGLPSEGFFIPAVSLRKFLLKHL